MKKIDWFILKSFIGPLALTFVLADFVLLMQFLWKYIDEMVGKGLDGIIIAKLLLYASATFVPMSLPIATLFASIMTMGNLGERYELVAMKAAGISLRRIMMPLALVVAIISGIAFFFANNVMPVANYKYKIMLNDVREAKPAFGIKPNEFYSEIDGYVIRVNKKDKDGKTLHDILIYDHTANQGNVNVTFAKKAFMESSKNGQYLYFTLFDGFNYAEDLSADKKNEAPFDRIYFAEQRQRFDLSKFIFEENEGNDSYYKNHYQMMNISQLRVAEDTLRKELRQQKAEIQQVFSKTLYTYNKYERDSVFPDQSENNLAQDSLGADSTATPPGFYALIDSLPAFRKQVVYSTALQNAKNAKSESDYYADQQKNRQELYNRHVIERHRKFTLSVACFLLFLIGAPFGSIVRKGGLGVPLVSSILFFVLYYVISMICEKSVREGAMDAMVGMWLSSYIFLPIGIFLTVKATNDSPLFDMDSWQRRVNWVKSIFKKD